jgi:hypothetical protein
MPRFDGTGPNGEGPMTGGARGNCAPGARSAGTPATDAYGRPLGLFARFTQRLGLGRRGLRGGRGRGQGRRW